MKIAPTPANEVQRLASLRSYSILDCEPEVRFQDIVSIASVLCDTPAAVLTLIDENRQWFAARKGIQIAETPRDVAFCAHTILTEGVLVVSNAIDDERFRDNPMVVGEPGIRFYAGAPIVDESGHALGTVAVLDFTPRSLSGDQQNALQALARQALAQLQFRRDLLQQRSTTRTAQLELAQVSERLRLAMNAANVGLWDWDLAADTVFFSPNWKSQIGYADEEIPNHFSEWQKRVHPQDIHRVMGSMQHCIANPGESFSEEFRFLHRDGSYRWILTQGSILVDESGRPLRFIGVHIDRTNRKVAEDLLRDRENELLHLLSEKEKAEAKFQELARSLHLLLSHLPGLVYRCHNDDDWTMDFVSDGVKEVSGFSPGDFTEKKVSWASLIHPEDQTTIRHNVQTALGQKRPFQLTYRIRTASGEEKWVWEQGAGVFSPSGDLKSIEGFIGDITEYKRAEQAVIQERDFSSAVLKSMPGVFYLLNEQGQLLRWNTQLEELTGYTSAQLYHLPATKLFDASNLQLISSRISDVFANGEGSAEAKFIARDGRRVPYYLTGRRILVNDQKCLIGMGIDISARVQAEVSLRASEQRLRELIDGLGPSVLVGLLDKDGIIIDANKPALESADLRREDILGKHLAETTWWSYSPEVQRRLRTALEDAKAGKGSRFDAMVLGKNGFFDVDFSVQPLRNEQGEVVCLVPSAIDITQRTKAEAAVRESEERLRLLIENSSDLISMLNREGDILFQNRSAERILGWKSNDRINAGLSKLIHPEDYPNVARVLDEAFENPDKPFSAEFRCRHSDGGWRVLESLGKVIPGSSGEKLLLVSSRDVTTARHTAEDLRQSQKLEAIGQLSAGVAHDFNNIMAIILGYASFAAHENENQALVREALEEIRLAAERAANLTKQLLTFGRRQIVQMQEIEINELLTGTLGMLRRILREDIDLNITPAPEPLFTQADSGMLEQVIVNLAINARDAMPSGGQISIKTYSREFNENECAHLPSARPGSYVCVRLSDTGAGIPREHLHKIFDPFFTTKEVGKGSGLGLATVYGIVQQHLGWITVESTVGSGTTFYIYLPRTRAHTSGVPGSQDPVALTGTETILLVEDEHAVRKLIASFLSQLGYSVLEAPDGPSAMRLCQDLKSQKAVDLLITDMVMPKGMHGMDLARNLAERLPGLKVIFTTGYHKEIGSEVTNGGVRLIEGLNFLQKPYHPTTLAKTIRRSLGASS